MNNVEYYTYWTAQLNYEWKSWLLWENPVCFKEIKAELKQYFDFYPEDYQNFYTIVQEVINDRKIRDIIIEPQNNWEDLIVELDKKLPT